MNSRNQPNAAGWITIALVITFSMNAIPRMVAGYGRSWAENGPEWLGHRNFHTAVELTIALLLVLPSAKAYGLCIGDIRKYWRRVLFFCAVPIILTSIAVSIMPANPFEGAASGLWLFSPLAQDLVFAGFLWPHFNRCFPGNVSNLVPIPRGVFLCATCFMLYHLVNFASMPASFVCFQLFYTFVGGVWTGMTRFWTGSVIYMTMTHMIVNFIASR